MAALIEEEGLDEDGKPVKHYTSSHQKSKWKLKLHKSTAVGDDADKNKDDGDYSGSDSDGQLDFSSESDNDSDVQLVSNDEVCTQFIIHIFSMLIDFLACWHSPFKDCFSKTAHKVKVAKEESMQHHSQFWGSRGWA